MDKYSVLKTDGIVDGNLLIWTEEFSDPNDHWLATIPHWEVFAEGKFKDIVELADKLNQLEESSGG